MSLVKDKRKEQYTYYSLNLEEELFESILEDIVNNVGEYPTLRLDIEKSNAAARYIELKEAN